MLLAELLEYFIKSDDLVDGQVTYYPRSSQHLLRLVDDDIRHSDIHVIESITVVDATDDEEACMAIQIAHCEDAVTRALNSFLPIIVYTTTT